MQCWWYDVRRMAQKGRTMRVRTVFDLGTDSLYIRTHELLLVDADVTEAEYEQLVKMAETRQREGSGPLRVV
jgi:hypothetical protein